MALRKNFVFLTTAERTQLADAFAAVKASAVLSELTDLYTLNVGSGIKSGSAFLPWHRWFLRKLEEAMQVEVPRLLIPYWDWTRPDSQSLDAEPWASFFGGRKNQGGRFDTWNIRRAADSRGNKLPTSLPHGVDSIVERLAEQKFAGFRTIEATVGTVGKWVGGTMGTDESPADPLFWLHLCNVDRLWAIWQRNNSAAEQYTLEPALGDLASAMVPKNSAMIGEATPASMLDHHTFGYSYDTDVRLEGAWESTEQLSHLVTGDPTAVDLYIRDSAADVGITPTANPHWESPDIWVRNQPPGPTEDPEKGHQSPIVNQVNHVYVRVHNRGARSTGPFSVEAYHCSPGTGMVWPRDFQSMGTVPVTGTIAPNGAQRVGPLAWTPTAVGHECLVAIVRAETQDPGSLESLSGSDTIPPGVAPLDYSLLVRFDNNVGQRNVAPILAAPGMQRQVALAIRGLPEKATHSLEIDAMQLPPDTVIKARIANSVLGGTTDMAVETKGKVFTSLRMDGGNLRGIRDFEIEAKGSYILTLNLDFSFKAEHLKKYPLLVSQLHEGRTIGAYTIELEAIKDLDDFFWGNPRSHELHLTSCPLWPQMNKPLLVPYPQVPRAVAEGYNGCNFCLPEHNSG